MADFIVDATDAFLPFEEFPPYFGVYYGLCAKLME